MSDVMVLALAVSFIIGALVGGKITFELVMDVLSAASYKERE